MFNTLTDASTGLVRPPDAVLLLGSSATRVAIIHAIRGRRDQLKANEALIVYWSGHSFYSVQAKEVFLIAYDAKYQEDNSKWLLLAAPKLNWIALGAEIFDSTPEDAALIFLGDGSGIGAGSSERIGASSSNIGVLSASKTDERAFETVEGSPFTGSLQRVLTSPNADLDGDGFISLEEAYVQMYPEAISKSFGRQHPTVSGSRIHRLMLARALLPNQALEFDSQLPEDIVSAPELLVNGKPVQVDRQKSTSQQLVLLGFESNGHVGKGMTYIETKKHQYLYWREEQALQKFENPYKNSFAVLVAIDDYDRKKDPKHRGRNRLQSARIHGATSRRTARSTDSPRICQGEYITPYDQDATSEAMKSFWEGRTREAADRVFFYFGGHGDTFDGSGVLITYNFDRRRPTSTGYLMRDLITRQSENMSTYHVLFTIDACAAGLAVYKALGKDSFLSDPRRFQQLSIIRNDTADKARNFLVAGTEDQPAIWDKGGIFTRALISGLNRNADLNEDGLIQFGELSTYVANVVATRAAEQGVRQEVQPYVLDRLGTGKMLFIFEESSTAGASREKE